MTVNESEASSLNTEDASLQDLLHGTLLAISEHLQILEDRLNHLENSTYRFANQTRLLMGALMQNQSPEVILGLLTDASLN